MKLEKKTIEHVAKLARLKLQDNEISEFLPQLKEVLNYFSELDKIDTKEIKPSFQPVGIRNVMRDDKEKECLSQEDALKNTAHKKDNYFKGPRAV